MIRSLASIALALFTVIPAAAQEGASPFNWNGPFTGTTNWSLGNWSPSTPPAGGFVGAQLFFNQLGAGAYTAANNLGNPFVLDILNFNSAGGGITISSLAGNTLQMGPSSFITQNGIGNAVISSTMNLTGSGATEVRGANFGNLQFGSALSGNNTLVINRPQNQFYTGLVDLSVANTNGDGVSLMNGNLRVGNNFALGLGSLVVSGGSLGATTPTIISNIVIIDTGANLVYSGFNNLNLTSPIVAITSGGVTLSTMTNSTLTLNGTNTYTGPTNAVVNPFISTNSPGVGSLTFSGTNGSSNQSTSFTFNGGGTLTLDNSIAASNNNNRINNAALVSISGGSFVLNGANGGATLENIGGLAGRGSVFVTLDAATAGNTGTTLQADNLTRNNRGQFLFRGSNASFGGALGANVPRLIFDAAPALSGGGGGSGTTTISIIPYAIGGTSTTSTGTDLVTYGANGVRPLSAAANEYATTITSGSTTLDNTRLTAAQAVTAPTQINALIVATTTPFTGSTSTLTLANGTLLNTSAFSVPAAMTLAFGSSEGFLFNNADMTVDGILTGSNGLTKSGNSNLNLNNINNNVTGPLTINAGLVAFTDPAAIGSFGNIVVNGRVSVTGPGLSLTGAGNATVAKAMTVTDGFVRLGAGTGTLTYSGAIDGAGGVLVRGGTVELTNTTNTYSGQTRVFGGNLLVSGDNVLGNGGGVDFGSGASSGLRLTGNWTTSRQINFSFNGQVDTNGFNWTINSPLTGNAPTINKTGAGIWTLSQGGALGQSLTSGATATTTTVNVSGGELRVTNPTGSATGTANVSIFGTSILSGASGIAGATTIGPIAFIRPGTGGTTIGSLDFGSTLTIDGGTYNVDGAGTTADQINVLGAVTLDPGSTLSFAGTFDPSTTFNLMNFASFTNGFGSVINQPASHTLVYNLTNIQLVPVPEPVAILAVAGLGLAIGHRFRKRLKK